MHFLLSSISVVYVLTTPMPKDSGDHPIVEQVRKKFKWDNDKYVCRGLILNGMSDPLFDIYHNVESSKELWDSFKTKYMVEDASISELAACLEKLHFPALLVMSKFSRICFSFVILEVPLSEYFGIDMNYAPNFLCSI
ncbi:hypothetical protein Tco_0827553 [Tanacetum coccineum]